MKYYAYLLIDPRNNQPFYAGKGQDKRMYVHETETKSGTWGNRTKCTIIKEILDDNLDIIYKQFSTKNDEESRKLEKKLISKYGRLFNESGILTNVHVGGAGGGKIGEPVYQYDRMGNFIAKYKSAAEAGRKTNIPKTGITAVCRGEYKTCRGYQWKKKDDKPINNYVRKSSHNHKKVKQYDFDGNFIAEYESQYLAAKSLNNMTGVKRVSVKISQCCRNILPSYLGFQWKFSEDSNVGRIHRKKKKVIQYSMGGKMINTYESIADAVRETSVSCVSKCCNGDFAQAGGFIWKFKDEGL